jgi:hypothetical protein
MMEAKFFGTTLPSSLPWPLLEPPLRQASHGQESNKEMEGLQPNDYPPSKKALGTENRLDTTKTQQA